MAFVVAKPFQGKEGNVLFEPNEKLPPVIWGTTSLGNGNKIYIQLDNTSEDDQVLNPDWEIGTAEIVEEEPDLPRTEMEEAGLPAIPEDLSYEKKGLEALLREFQDVFTGKRLKLGNTPVIKHEIHSSTMSEAEP